MNIEEIRNYCLSKKGAIETFPFDEVTLVFKVMDKMFGLVPLDGDLSINLKCDPEKAIALREEFPCVQPGYHMSKKHWNTVIIDSSVSANQIYQWIDDSYNLIVGGLSKKLREELDSM